MRTAKSDRISCGELGRGWALCAVVAIALCGCGGNNKAVHKLNYFQARWADLTDIMPVGYGLAYGVHGLVVLPWPVDTPVGVGFARQNHYSLGDRNFEWREDWHTGLPFSPIWVQKKGGHCIFEGWECDAIFRWFMPTGITMHAKKHASSQIIKAYPQPSAKWRKISKAARVHVGVGALAYLGLGINFAEILDFVVGLTTLDMADDDTQRTQRD